MNTPNNSSTETKRSQATREVILNSKRAELNACITNFFDIGGLQMPIELLKELLSDYIEHARDSKCNTWLPNHVSNNTFYTIELMSFLSILYEKIADVQHIEEEIHRN